MFREILDENLPIDFNISVKDKAKLLYQVENLSKLNADLNENIKILHSELEQERSKCHAALSEYRKLLEVIKHVSCGLDSATKYCLVFESIKIKIFIY